MSNAPENFFVNETVADFLDWISDYFDVNGLYFGHGTDNSRDDALALITYVFGEDPFVDKRFAKLRVDNRRKQLLWELVEKRVAHRIPAPYLTGEAWFCGLKFAVNQDVLIPRSPIAELIENQFQPWLPQQPLRILDLCSGSGCIGIACAYAFPEAEVILSDICTKALAVAERNIQLHQMEGRLLEGRVTRVESDLFDNLKGEQFDLIISNSPYVNAEDIADMPEEYRHEPILALESGNDGLNFTRRLLAQAGSHLTEKGLLVAEVGNSWIDLDASFPELPFTWLEFQYGGHGVFALDKHQLPG